MLIHLKSSHDAREADYEIIRLDIATYNYLWDKLQVVRLVKYVETENETYWLLLNSVPEPTQSQDSFTIRIPKRNRPSTIILSFVVRQACLAHHNRYGSQWKVHFQHKFDIFKYSNRVISISGERTGVCGLLNRSHTPVPKLLRCYRCFC